MICTIGCSVGCRTGFMKIYWLKNKVETKVFIYKAMSEVSWVLVHFFFCVLYQCSLFIDLVLSLLILNFMFPCLGYSMSFFIFHIVSRDSSYSISISFVVSFSLFFFIHYVLCWRWIEWYPIGTWRIYRENLLSIYFYPPFLLDSWYNIWHFIRR